MVTFAARIDCLAERDPTAPQGGLCASIVYSGALDFPFPVKHPDIKSSVRVSGERTTKKAPMAPYEFVVILERVASGNSQLEGFRLFRALFLIMIFASLRFPETIDVSDLRRTKSASAEKFKAVSS